MYYVNMGGNSLHFLEGQICACLCVEVQVQFIPPLFRTLPFFPHSGSSVIQDVPFSEAAVKAELFRPSNWPEWR